MSQKRAVLQWCTEEADADIGADRIGQNAAEVDADRMGLTIAGDVTVQRLDARVDMHRPPTEGVDYPPGMPILVRAEYVCGHEDITR